MFHLSISNVSACFHPLPLSKITRYFLARPTEANVQCVDLSMPRSTGRSAVEKATVLVADATPMDCQLVSDAIQRHNHFRVIGRATSSSEIVSAVRKVQPDVAVISARLQDGALGGLLALRGLRALQARSRVVLLLDTDKRELVVEAFLNNARGIFCRIGSSGELRKCIQSVHNGQIWVNNSQLEYIVEALMQAPARCVTSGRATTLLSKREEEIARLVAAGLPNRDVSDKLGLSQHTVKNNLSRIFEKLGISTRIELVLYVLSQAKPSETQNDLGSHVSYQISA
jgi:two-component system, NarL family, nitrate/nitrite response regulator NarL